MSDANVTHSRANNFDDALAARETLGILASVPECQRRYLALKGQRL